MQSVRIVAHAKVNLTLEIVGRESGFHLLDSLVASVDLSDVIRLRKRKGKLSSVWSFGQGSESIPPEKNNALIAAERYSARFGTDGADIRILKDIPIGAGMGGSSADMAGVLLGMQQLYGAATDEQLEELAMELGSDVKFMLKGGYARMQGRGEYLTAVDGVQAPLHLLVLVPKVGVSAGESYRAYDSQNQDDQPTGATEKAILALQENDPQGVGRCLMNDLYLPSASLCPSIKTALDDLLALSPLGAVMTGSGSAVVAVFETEEQCRWAKSRYKGKCRAYVLKTIDPQKKEIWRSPYVLS